MFGENVDFPLLGNLIFNQSSHKHTYIINICRYEPNILKQRGYFCYILIGIGQTLHSAQDPVPGMLDDFEG